MTDPTTNRDHEQWITFVGKTGFTRPTQHTNHLQRAPTIIAHPPSSIAVTSNGPLSTTASSSTSERAPITSNGQTRIQRRKSNLVSQDQRVHDDHGPVGRITGTFQPRRSIQLSHCVTSPPSLLQETHLNKAPNAVLDTRHENHDTSQSATHKRDDR